MIMIRSPNAAAIVRIRAKSLAMPHLPETSRFCCQPTARWRAAEGTGVETITAADAKILAVQHDGIRRRVKAIDRAYRRARRISAVHARHRYRAFARFAVIERDHASAIDAPGHLVFVFAGG